MAGKVEAIETEGVSKGEDVFGKGSLLACDEVGLEDVGGAEAAQVRNQNAEAIAIEAVDDAVPGNRGVRKAVQE